jgi:hypothetical protein
MAKPLKDQTRRTRTITRCEQDLNDVLSFKPLSGWVCVNDTHLVKLERESWEFLVI